MLQVRSVCLWREWVEVCGFSMGAQVVGCTSVETECVGEKQEFTPSCLELERKQKG